MEYIILIIFLISILLLEFFLQKNKRVNLKDMPLYDNLQRKLDILREISYSFSRTHQSFEGMLDSAVRLLLKETKLHAAMLIKNNSSDNVILKYMPNTSWTRQEEAGLSSLEKYFSDKLLFMNNAKRTDEEELKYNLINIPLETKGISLIKEEENYTFVIGSILDGNNSIILVSYSPIKEFDVYEKTFIKIMLNIITLIIKRGLFEKEISHEEQMKAVNIPW